MEVLNDEVLHKPGYREKMQIKELETKLSKEKDSKAVLKELKSEKSANDKEEEDDWEETSQKDSELDSSFKSDDPNMRKSQSFFKTDTPSKKDGKAEKQITTAKSVKEQKKNVHEEMIDTEEKFKDFVDEMSLQMYHIKAKADEILKCRKMRDPNTPSLKEAKLLESSGKKKDNQEHIEEVDSLLESSTVIKNSELSGRFSESTKEPQSEVDIEQLRKLEEKYRGQFIGSREDANAVKRNVLIR